MSRPVGRAVCDPSAVTSVTPEGSGSTTQPSRRGGSGETLNGDQTDNVKLSAFGILGGN